MATNRAKLSLRRTRKPTRHAGASQPVTLPSSGDTASPPELLPSGGMVSDNRSPAAKSVAGSVECGSVSTDRDGGEEAVGEEEDFHPQPLSKSGLGKKRKQLLTTR